MSHEGQLSANMQVDDEIDVNWGTSLGEGSAQGIVVAQGQSHLDLADLLLRELSASCSPTPKGQTKSPNTASKSAWGTYCRGDSRDVPCSDGCNGS